MRNNLREYPYAFPILTEEQLSEPIILAPEEKVIHNVFVDRPNQKRQAKKRQASEQIV